MFALSLLAFTNHLWYYLPLIVAVSLVYGATRHELMGPILAHAWQAGIWISGFMGALLLVLYFISLRL